MSGLAAAVGLALLLATALGALWLYNRLVDRRHAVARAWAQVDVQLTRRHDLLPALVDAVRAHMRHELRTLGRVTALRARARAAPDGPPRLAAERALGREVASLRAEVEDWPELRTDETVARLLEEVTTTESRIAFARQHYNECVKRLNDAVRMLPSSLVAASLGMGTADYFETEDEDEPGRRSIPRNIRRMTLRGRAGRPASGRR